jgi:hypothetical protein
MVSLKIFSLKYDIPKPGFKISMKRYFLFFILLFSHFLFGQGISNPGQIILEKPQNLHDYEVLIQAIESIHPNQHLFLSKSQMESAKKELKNSLSRDLSTDELHLKIRQFIRKLGCGHTLAKPSADWYANIKNNTKLLPFTVYLVGGKAYFNEVYDRDSLLKRGWQILSIDDRAIDDIQKDMLAIQERDGISNAYSWHRIQRLFTTYYLFLYGQKEEYKLNVLNEKGKEEILLVHRAKREKKERKDNMDFLQEIRMNNARFYIESEDPGLGILDIDRFNSKGFKKFYKAVFKEIEERQINTLVLDLRNNGGGYFPNGNTLLKYLLKEDFKMTFNRPKLDAKKPDEAHLAFGSKMTNFLFNLIPDKEKEDPRRNYDLNNKVKSKYHFAGDLYVLTNGGTFSLGSYVSTYLKHQSDAIFIGSETGGGEFGSNAVITYKLTLPESGIRVDIPYYFLNHQIPRDDNFGRGVQVQHKTEYSISDLLQGRDKEMEKVKSILHQ